MRLSDAQWVPATQHQTWQALNDPAVIQKCLPGCTQVERVSDAEFLVTVQTRVAGIAASYQGELLIADVDAPNGCTLAFEGKGQAAGLVIGTAQVNLSPKDKGTRVSYTVAAQVGGKLQELGEKAVRGAAEHIIEAFFAAFTDHACRLPKAEPPAQREERGLLASNWSWAAVLGVVGILVTYHFMK
ncbi:carbon monoxide dehydrogenase subunit G [Orrella sp. JC864]|uniref:SRPBCC family protein n=1 Tax=Orrella sp. JC864 TaxID=3120298 RepID=UPI00300B02AA